MTSTCLQTIVDEYKKSIVQSEAEVRSKLIVPLLEALGYPSYLRAEEFPVYGFEGERRLPAKNADFAMFSDKEFAAHRSFTQKDIEWVYEHSLLIVEAKKPGKMPMVLGQPMFYTMWTRAVAYLSIDGLNVKGYYYNCINSDLQVIDCTVENLPFCEKIWELSYERILEIKKQDSILAQNRPAQQSLNTQIVIEGGCSSKARLADANTIKAVTEDEVKDFPAHSLNYMRHALGRNAEGLSNLQLISRFLNTTDNLLQNDMRYDVPRYILDMPRRTYKAALFINNIVFPMEMGEITEFYWNDDERYIFESRYIQVLIVIHKQKIIDFEIGFRVLDRHVAERIVSFEKVQRILSANSIKISMNDCSEKEFVLPSGKPGKKWASKKEKLSMCAFWKNGLEQMKVIEDFYNVKFELEYVTGYENLIRLYDAISFVYDGIAINQNCEIKLPGDVFEDNVIIDEPIVFEDDNNIPLDIQRIHNINFVPYRSWILPGKIAMKGKTTVDTVWVPGCVSYKVVEK